jgi:ubiquinone/menaquinone biosynthesis C-methylase UbiE
MTGKKVKNETSWGKVADWYSDHVDEDDTYHAKVVGPNLMRMLAVAPSETVLDLACGEGYFSRLIQAESAEVCGADIAPELIEQAKAKSGGIEYVVAPADKLPYEDSRFDAVTCVLALQNMERIETVFKEVARVLRPAGRFVAVINHPAYRINKRSSWGYDEALQLQYRRVDGYLTPSKASIEMRPGSKASVTTVSFHRSLQDHMKALRGAGFVVTRLEEWISHRQSEDGPRKKAEDAARKEFPLFLAFEVKRMQS